jgi:aminotransferase EvaB
LIPFNRLGATLEFRKEVLSQIDNLLISGVYLNGKYTDSFEEKFAQLIGVNHASAVSSGTAALTLALRSLNLPKGSKLITTANSGGYARISAELNGLETHYVDVDLNGLLDVRSISHELLLNARVMIVTHMYGQCANLKEITSICKKFDILLIEDCAQSIGAKFEDRMVGSFGDLATFSFYPTKNLGGIGDAGMVVTDSLELIQKVRSLKQYGWKSKYFCETPHGDNLRIDEIQALILSFKLPNLLDYNKKRLKIWEKYLHAINGKNLRLIGKNSDCFVAHLAVIDAGSHRERLKKFLNNYGIETAIHYPFLDFEQPGLRISPTPKLENSEYLSKSILSIPLFPNLEDHEVEYICEKLSEYEMQ